MKHNQSVSTTVTGAAVTDVIMPSGKKVQVAVLTPEETRPLAVVDLEVLKRLAMLLPGADFDTIKQETMDKLFATKGLEEMVEVMENEVAFHNSVNLIQMVKIERKEEAQPVH